MDTLWKSEKLDQDLPQIWQLIRCVVFWDCLDYFRPYYQVLSDFEIGDLGGQVDRHSDCPCAF